MSCPPTALPRAASTARWVVACICLLPVCVTAASVSPEARNPPHLAFTIKDQYDKTFTEAVCAGQTAIVTIADREGSAFTRAWGVAIGHELGAVNHPETRWLGVATLSSVPGFMHGFVRKMFAKDNGQSTLLDWRGHFAKTYQLPPNRCNILVFAPDGRLLLRTGGREVDPAVVTSIVAAVVASDPSTATARAD